jgi:hypothetical protein
MACRRNNVRSIGYMSGAWPTTRSICIILFLMYKEEYVNRITNYVYQVASKIYVTIYERKCNTRSNFLPIRYWKLCQDRR